MARRGAISRVLTLDASVEGAPLERVLKALDSLNRIRILRYLSDRVASVNDIAAALELPTSTAALHVETLEEAGLIRTEFEPASRGLRKVCARMYDQIVLDLPIVEQPREQAIELSMPIGAFADCQVTPTCGLLSETGIIGLLDDPASFYEPDRRDTQLLWFLQGYIEYRFPNRLPAGAQPESLRLPPKGHYTKSGGIAPACVRQHLRFRSRRSAHRASQNVPCEMARQWVSKYVSERLSRSISDVVSCHGAV